MPNQSQNPKTKSCHLIFGLDLKFVIWNLTLKKLFSNLSLLNTAILLGLSINSYTPELSFSVAPKRSLKRVSPAQALWASCVAPPKS